MDNSSWHPALDHQEQLQCQPHHRYHFDLLFTVAKRASVWRLCRHIWVLPQEESHAFNRWAWCTCQSMKPLPCTTCSLCCSARIWTVLHHCNCWWHWTARLSWYSRHTILKSPKQTIVCSWWSQSSSPNAATYSSRIILKEITPQPTISDLEDDICQVDRKMNTMAMEFSELKRQLQDIFKVTHTSVPSVWCSMKVQNLPGHKRTTNNCY